MLVRTSFAGHFDHPVPMATHWSVGQVEFPTHRGGSFHRGEQLAREIRMGFQSCGGKISRILGTLVHTTLLDNESS